MVGIGTCQTYEELAELCVELLSAELGVERSHLELPSNEAMFQHFNVLQSGLAFSFDEHTIAGKWLGAPSILVPYSRILPIRERLDELGVL